jgi:DHA1 family tetracycline resistance protein-like MFS transporter
METSRRRAALGFIFVTVVLDMVALGVIVPVLPRLIADFVHGDLGSASEYLGWFTAAWALMQFVFAPILGMLSDRFGRRPVVLLSNFGLGLDYIIMALAPTLSWLFIGRLFSGITSSSIPTATAYISDVTTVENRSRAFGFLGAAFGFGFVVGPAMGGWLGAFNPRLPFWVAGTLSLLNALYGLLVLPESLPVERRQPKLRWTRANPVGSLRLLLSHPELSGLAVVNFLGYLAHEVYVTVYVLYAIYRYGWSQRSIGLALAIVGIASMVISGTLVGPVVKRLGERRALFTGLILGAIGFALFGWAPAGWIFLAVIPVNSLWALAGPPSQSLMTQRVSPSEQGQLQGALSSLRGVAMVAGPPMFSGLFAMCIAPGRNFPGAPWYLAGMLVAASLIVALMVTSRAGAPTGSSMAEKSAAG